MLEPQGTTIATALVVIRRRRRAWPHCGACSRQPVVPGTTRILQCSSGWASSSNAAGTSSMPTSPVIIGTTSIAPSAIELQALRELRRVVAEHELEVELLADAEERRQRVGLHADADDDDAALRRARPGAARRSCRARRRPRTSPSSDRRRPGSTRRTGSRRAGSTTSWAPIVTPSARRGGREVAGHDRRHAEQPEGGDHGQPDRSAPDDDGAVTGLQARAVHGVQADGHRLGERSQPRREPVGTGIVSSADSSIRSL